MSNDFESAKTAWLRQIKLDRELSRQGRRPEKIRQLADLSAEQASKLFSVGLRSVERACEVRDSGVPDLVALVGRGELAVSRAATIARNSADFQQTFVENFTELGGVTYSAAWRLQ